MASKNTRSAIQFLVLLGIGVLLVWLSLRQVASQKDNIITAFRNANYSWIAISLLVSFMSHFLRAFRWNYLLNPIGYKPHLLNAACHVLVGYMANYGIPRMGEVSRCALAAKYDKVPFEVGFGTVITERIIDFLLFLIIFFIALMVQFNELIGLANQYVFDKLGQKLAGISQSPAKLVVLVVVVIAVIAGFFLLRKKFSSLLKGKLGGIIKGMGEGVGSIRKMEKPLQFIILSLLIWLSYFYALYFCFFALDGTKQLGYKECLTLLLMGPFGVIFSPGGLGAYPLILYGILVGTYHVDEVSAFALPWLSWTSQFVLIIIAGLISLIVLPIYNRNKNVVSPTAEG